jgi:hypothetical protein
MSKPTEAQTVAPGYAVTYHNEPGHRHVVVDSADPGIAADRLRRAILDLLASPEGRAAVLAILETKEAQAAIVEAVRRHESRGKR